MEKLVKQLKAEVKDSSVRCVSINNKILYFYVNVKYIHLYRR